ncbi:hypothetical protein DFH94DRAFT_656891, partial [Russula ochroleuca]
MSHTHSSSSSSNFQSVFNVALDAYESKTESSLLTHPLAAELQSCDSPTAILSILQDLIQQFDRRRRSDQRLTSWLNPTINVLYAFSGTIGQGVGLAFSPANAVFSGIGVLLLAAKDVDASQDVLIDIFVRMGSFFKRLDSYTEVRPTAAMTDVIVKVMIEVLSILAIATKEIKQGRSKKFVNNLLGRNDIADALKRLDTLTQEEARMAIAEILNVTHRVDDNVNRVDDNVNRVDDNVNRVGDNVNRVGDNVNSVDDKVNKVDEKVSALIDDVKEANAGIQRSASIADKEKLSQSREKAQQWLSPNPPDPSTNHNIARKAHHDGTTSWFFQGSIFEEWKSSPSLLWIHGKPGSGKSVLCSGIIEDIMARCEAESAIAAYFYCDFRDEYKQNCRNLIVSIISQLCAQSNRCCDILSRIYLEHGKGVRKPSDETLTNCLAKMVSLPAQGPIYIIVDGLDECPNNLGMPTPREEVLDLVEDIVSLRVPNLHICVTSRPEIDIQTILEPLTSLRVSLHDQTGQKKDIVDYVSSVVYSDKKMRRWREEDRKLVIEKLSERADGMFRWVYCQLAALRHCLPASVGRILEELPETLDETYERVLREINKANRDHARRLLQFLTVALRPLRVEELAEVLAIDFDAPADRGIPQSNPNWRWTDHHQAVLSTCSSLIAIVDDGGYQVVQFSHFSVKEYLTSDRLARSSTDVSRYHILLEPAHTILAQACLGVLLRLDDHVDVGDIPLVEYAAENWIDHARFENVSSHIRDAMEYFLDADKPHWASWSRVQTTDVEWLSFSPDW